LGQGQFGEAHNASKHVVEVVGDAPAAGRWPVCAAAPEGLSNRAFSSAARLTWVTSRIVPSVHKKPPLSPNTFLRERYQAKPPSLRITSSSSF
jgi:hypothetical protein